MSHIHLPGAVHREYPALGADLQIDFQDVNLPHTIGVNWHTLELH